MSNYDLWIESHLNLSDHPKVHKLSRTLCVRYADALGTVHLLWYYAMRHAWRDGDLTKYGREAIEGACKWPSEKGDLIKALQDSGLLDDLIIHDWIDFAGRLVKDRLRYEKTHKKARKVRTQSVREPYAVRTPSVSNHTLPNHTLPNLKKTPLFDFEMIWKDYPRKLGKDEAKRHFNAQVRTTKDWLDIQNSLARYREKLLKDATEERFIQHGATWFNKRWKDWISYEAPKVPSRVAPTLAPPPPTPKISATEQEEGAKFFGTVRQTLGKGKEIPR